MQEKMNWIPQLRSYCVTAIIAYIVIQASGLVLVGLVVSIMSAGATGTSFGPSSMAPLAIMLGAFITCVPTALYSFILPAVVWIVQRHTNMTSIVFTYTSVLALITFLVCITVGTSGTNIMDIVDPITLLLSIIALPPAWLGTHVVRKMIAQQSPESYFRKLNTTS